MMATEHYEFQSLNAAAEASSANLDGMIASICAKMIMGKKSNYFKV